MTTAAIAIIAKARRDIQHHFFAADAVRADRAVAFTPANSIEARQFARMLDSGSIKRAGADRYWIDVVAYDVEVHRRHHRVRLVLVALVIVLAIGLIVLGTGGGHS
jgi:hypothetical protein